MFSDYDALIKTALEEPNEVWSLLDSFWRSRTDASTETLVHYQTFAALTLMLNTHAKHLHLLSTQDVPQMTSWVKQPWFPLVIFKDRLTNSSLYKYGDPTLTYQSPSLIVYGEVESTSRFVYRLPSQLITIHDIPEFVDSITTSRVVIDPSQFSYDNMTGDIEFLLDPFTIVTPKVSSDGREYIVLWMRNPEIDLNVPFDQVGWVLKYDRVSVQTYAESLKSVWELALLGPSWGRYRRGLLDAMGLPYARSDAQVVRVDNDGWQWAITTDQGQLYTVAPSTDIQPLVSAGDLVKQGDPLTDGVVFAEYAETLNLSSSALSGLLLRVPLSTGEVAAITFANTATEWTYEAGRPSEFRFPVGGDDPAIEQFWVDVDTFATANGIDFQTLYGLSVPGSPGPTGDVVNPMHRIIQDLLHNSLVVASVTLSELPEHPGGYHDRARLLLPTDILLILHQIVDDVSDSYDLGTETSDSVTYGYNTDVPTEVISVSGSGTDLIYFDYVPLVVIS